MAKSFITAPFGGNAGADPLPMCRIAYAQGLSKANDDGKFSVTLIFPKSDVGRLQKAVADVVVGEWGDKGIDRFKKGLIKNPILDGDGKSAMNKDTGELNPGMGPDVKFIRPWTKRAPLVLGADGRPTDPESIRSGWWGYPVLTAFAWHNPEQGDGVGFWISHWMHAKEDEVFAGSGSIKVDDFFKAETITTSNDGNASGGAAGMFD